MWSKALSASAFAATAHAVSVSVASEGGNATSPYAYGFMFEVLWRRYLVEVMRS